MEMFFKKNATLSEESSAEFNNLFSTLQAQAESTMDLLENFSLEKMGETFELSGKMKFLCTESEKNHLDRLKKGQCKAENSLFYLELVAEFQKVSRHFENIAERAGACIGKTFGEA
jgi:phosphate:Na+ symporter